MFFFFFLFLRLRQRKVLERPKLGDVPFTWDDPTDKENVKFTVKAFFNQVLYISV